MPNQFNQNTVQQYGGVAWAKQQIESLDPAAIGDQIKGYQDVTTSLNNIVDTLSKANASIQSAWTGDAATAASQTFTETSNHAQTVITAVTNTITQLKSAQSAATAAQQAMRNVPDEKPVPSGGLFSGFTNTMSDIFTGTDPVQQAQQHNTAARNQAADILNKLSTSYDNAATNMSTIANSGKGGGFKPSTPPPSGSFNLGSGSYGGGSGAAASYGFHGGSTGGGTARQSSTSGVTNGVFHEGGTSVAGNGTVTPPSTSTPPGIENLNTTTTTTTPGPIFGTPGDGLPLPLEEGTTKPGGGGTVFGDGPTEEGGSGGTSKFGSSNVFGEDGFGNGSGGPSRRTGSNLGGVVEGEEGAGPGGIGGSGAGSASGEQSAMHGMGGGRRGGGGSSGEEELGSSKYSRGRFFGGEEPGAGGEEWVQPSIGGNESLLVKESGRGAGTGRVASAYDGATDADGNPLHMMRGVGRPGASRDEDDERGERPDYLKEDPEWWQSAQKVAPPVIE